MKINEILELQTDELVHELENLRRKMFDIRTQAVTEKLEDPSQLTKVRKDIARILTVLRQRQIAGKKTTTAQEINLVATNTADEKA